MKKGQPEQHREPQNKERSESLDPSDQVNNPEQIKNSYVPKVNKLRSINTVETKPDITNHNNFNEYPKIHCFNFNNQNENFYAINPNVFYMPMLSGVTANIKSTTHKHCSVSSRAKKIQSKVLT